MITRLKKVVENAPDEEILFIGSNSQFFFIGTKKEYFKKIDKINNDYLKSINKTLDKIKKKVVNEYDRIHKYGYEKTDDDKIEKLFKIGTNTRSIKIMEIYLNKWKHFSDRTVLRTYKKYGSEGDNPGTVIIVRGKEIGSYWMTSEWDQFKGKITVKNCLKLRDDQEEEE